jgi:hypothetical protein
MMPATRERIMLVLVISIGFLVPKAMAQSDKYSKMAPVEQYLMDRNAEILLARSAAPDSISATRRFWSWDGTAMSCLGVCLLKIRFMS